MDIYDRITKILDEKKITRKDLSDGTGISYNTLTSQFQRKSDNMKLDTIVTIARFLKVSVEYLVTGSENLHVNESDENETSLNAPNIDLEINRVLSKLSYKDKTIILAKAYELEDKNQKK